LSYISGSSSINCTKTKLSDSSTFRAIKRNKQRVIEQLTLGNHAATQFWENWHPSLPVSWVS
jgi:hypothetical protein